MRLRERAQRLQLRLEESLVDLALVDRHALLHTEADHLEPVHPEFLRQLFRRQVVRHAAPSSRRMKKPAGALRGRASVVATPCRWRESKGSPPSGAHRLEG